MPLSNLFGLIPSSSGRADSGYGAARIASLQGTGPNPDSQGYIDEQTRESMDTGNTMYGRSVTGYRDEANRASDMGTQRETWMQNRGDRNLNTMQGLGDRKGANQQGVQQNEG